MSLFSLGSNYFKLMKTFIWHNNVLIFIQKVLAIFLKWMFYCWMNMCWNFEFLVNYSKHWTITGTLIGFLSTNTRQIKPWSTAKRLYTWYALNFAGECNFTAWWSIQYKCYSIYCHSFLFSDKKVSSITRISITIQNSYEKKQVKENVCSLYKLWLLHFDLLNMVLLQ